MKRHKYIKKENLIRKRKFTDEEYLKLYYQGLSDNKISKIFKCSCSSVIIRRTRLHLIANYPNCSGKKNNLEEIKIAEEKMLKRITENSRRKEVKEKRKEQRSSAKYKEDFSIWNKEYSKKPEVKKRKLKNSRTQKTKKKQKEYSDKNKVELYRKQRIRLSSKEGMEKRKKYLREYNQREDVKKKKKEWVEKNRKEKKRNNL